MLISGKSVLRCGKRGWAVAGNGPWAALNRPGLIRRGSTVHPAGGGLRRALTLGGQAVPPWVSTAVGQGRWVRAAESVCAARASGTRHRGRGIRGEAGAGTGAVRALDGVPGGRRGGGGGGPRGLRERAAGGRVVVEELAAAQQRDHGPDERHERRRGEHDDQAVVERGGDQRRGEMD